MRRATLLILFLLCSLAQAQQTGPIAAKPDLRVHPPKGFFSDGYQFGDLSRQLIVVFGRLPVLTQREIERIVGNPWEYEPTTAAKVRLLPPRLRMDLHSLYLDRMHRIEMVRDPSHSIEKTIAGDSTIQIAFDEKSAELVFNSLRRGFLRNFRNEEIIDFLVAEMARSEKLFPQTEEGWLKLRNQIVNHAVYLAAAAMLTALSVQEGAFRMSGWFAKLADDQVRLGWVFGVDRLGIPIEQPRVRAGLKATSILMDASAGLRTTFNADSDQEHLALELSVREHWLQLLADKVQGQTEVEGPRKIRQSLVAELVGRAPAPRVLPYPINLKLRGKWEVSVGATARQILAHGNTTEEGTWRAGGELFVRKDMLNGSPSVAFVGKANLTSNFRGEYHRAVTTGLESANGTIGIYLRAQEGNGLDPTLARAVGEDPAKPIYVRSLKALVAGSFGSTSKRNYRLIQSSRDRIFEQFRYLKERLHAFQEFELEHESPVDGITPDRNRDQEQLRHVRWIIDGRNELERLVEVYVDAWAEYSTVTLKEPTLKPAPLFSAGDLVILQDAWEVFEPAPPEIEIDGAGQ